MACEFLSDFLKKTELRIDDKRKGAIFESSPLLQ